MSCSLKSFLRWGRDRPVVMSLLEQTWRREDRQCLGLCDRDGDIGADLHLAGPGDPCGTFRPVRACRADNGPGHHGRHPAHVPDVDLLGFAFATFSTDIVQSFAFTRLLSLLFTTLAPVYYPHHADTDALALPGVLYPTTYAAEIGHDLIGSLSISTDMIVIDWAVLLGLTAAFLWVGTKKSQWREK